MEPLKPIHTFWLALCTVAILFVISIYEPKSNTLLPIKQIDIISSLRPGSESSSKEHYADMESEHYAENYSEHKRATPQTASPTVVAQNKSLKEEGSPKSVKEEPRGNTNKGDEKPDSDIHNDEAESGQSEQSEQSGQSEKSEQSDVSIKEQSSKEVDILNFGPSYQAPQIKSNPYAGNPHDSKKIDLNKTKTEPTVQKRPQGITQGAEIENSSAISLFINKLHNTKSLGRPIRIAVLGDSFIEGDIFTQDIRERFQSRFGGSGVGFMPMESSVSGFRRTIKHTFSGWSTRRISKNPNPDDYTISSHIYTPGDGTVSRYEGSTYRKHLKSFSRARLMFVNRGTTKVHTSINNEPKITHSPASSGTLQQITLLGDSIGSVGYSFTSSDNFTAYGVYLDGRSGVSVDNYSVRGNSGVSMSSTNINLMSQMNSLMPVDLIIVEYGLNTVQADRRDYTAYTQQIKKAVKHLQKAFPHADFLIMSVPDRAHLTAGGWQTMPGVTAMEQAQRELAVECDAAFWSTLQAMQHEGGMGAFVKNGWAAKDYTHLSPKGGRVLANSLFDAIMKKYNDK